MYICYATTTRCGLAYLMLSIYHVKYQNLEPARYGSSIAGVLQKLTDIPVLLLNRGWSNFKGIWSFKIKISLPRVLFDLLWYDHRGSIGKVIIRWRAIKRLQHHGATNLIEYFQSYQPITGHLDGPELDTGDQIIDVCCEKNGQTRCELGRCAAILETFNDAPHEAWCFTWL